MSVEKAALGPRVAMDRYQSGASGWGRVCFISELRNRWMLTAEERNKEQTREHCLKDAVDQFARV